MNPSAFRKWGAGPVITPIPARMPFYWLLSGRRRLGIKIRENGEKAKREKGKAENNYFFLFAFALFPFPRF
jgi:hypothetical protein